MIVQICMKATSQTNHFRKVGGVWLVMVEELTALAWAQPLCGDHILPSPIRPRARWASGARSPLAPTVPCSGTQDKHEAATHDSFLFQVLSVCEALNESRWN